VALFGIQKAPPPAPVGSTGADVPNLIDQADNNEPDRSAFPDFVESAAGTVNTSISQVPVGQKGHRRASTDTYNNKPADPNLVLK
jgi:hypothetical protein